MDPAIAADKDDATREDPTRELLTGGGGDRCSNCQAPLASDQRYCINCGERRGTARVAFATPASEPATARATQATQPAPHYAPPPQPRMPSGIAFILGVATLLLAMGVGVLIGQSISKNKTVPVAASAGPQVIKIQGGGGGGAGASASAGHGRAARHHASNVPAVHLSKKVTQAVNKAATNVLGSGAKNLAPATVRPGQACQGAGCQGGHFTGNFFGQ
jgi:hypothetical protein